MSSCATDSFIFSDVISFSSFKALAPWDIGLELLAEKLNYGVGPILEKSE